MISAIRLKRISAENTISRVLRREANCYVSDRRRKSPRDAITSNQLAISWLFPVMCFSARISAHCSIANSLVFVVPYAFDEFQLILQIYYITINILFMRLTFQLSIKRVN